MSVTPSSYPSSIPVRQWAYQGRPLVQGYRLQRRGEWVVSAAYPLADWGDLCLGEMIGAITPHQEWTHSVSSGPRALMCVCVCVCE